MLCQFWRSWDCAGTDIAHLLAPNDSSKLRHGSYSGQHVSLFRMKVSGFPPPAANSDYRTWPFEGVENYKKWPISSRYDSPYIPRGFTQHLMLRWNVCFQIFDRSHSRSPHTPITKVCIRINKGRGGILLIQPNDLIHFKIVFCDLKKRQFNVLNFLKI